jgi:hypothetical protein
MFKPDAQPYSGLDDGDWTFKDGHLYAKLPNGEVWQSVWKNRSGETVEWQVSGPNEAPTVSPSIWANPNSGKPSEWHGHLVNGEWREC